MTTATNAPAAKRFFIPMTKYDAEKGIAYGVAASTTLDLANEIFDYAGSKPYFEKWSAAAIKATSGKSMGNLRSMHGAVAAGKLDTLTFNDDDEQIEVAALVVDPVEKLKCEKGVYTGFSVGGKYIKRWKEGDATKYIADPYEISLVDLPCIPDATFEYVKVAGAQPELRKFHKPEKEPEPVKPSNDEVAAKARELAKEAGAEDKWLEHVEAARKALGATGGELKPQNVLEIAVTAVDETVEKGATSDDIGAFQVWAHPDLPGKQFKKKAELVSALAQRDAEATATTLAGPVHKAIASLTEVLDEKDPAGVRKNTSDNPDKATAEAKGKDGKKPPVDPKAAARAKAKEEADKSGPMKSAVDVIGRAKAHLAKALPSFVERRAILAAAAEFDAVAALPDGFVDAIEEPLQKIAKPEMAKAATLYQVSDLISLVASLESFHSRVSAMAGDGCYYYGGESVTRIDVSPDLLTKISTMCDALGESAAQLLDEILSAMKSDDAAKALGWGTALADLRKVGARNSATDKKRLRGAHDLLAEIDPDMCGTEKAAGDGDVSKALSAQKEAFTKTLGEIEGVLKDVADRVKRIEAQPINGRPSSVSVIEKGGFIDQVLNGGDESARAANERAFIEINADRARFAGTPPR